MTVEKLAVTCPNCGTTQSVPRAKVPPEGLWGRCVTCRERIFVSLETLGARPAAAEPAPGEDAAVDGPAPPSVWNGPAVPEPADAAALAPPHEGDGAGPALEGPLLVRTPSGATERLAPAAIAERIRDGRLLPPDLVSTDGEGWTPAQKRTELGELFREGRPTPPRGCWRHPDATPERTCVRCHRSYCRSCLPATRPEASVLACPACAGLLEEADPGLREPPVWRRLADAARFPLEEDGWKLTVGLGLTRWLAGLHLLLLPLGLASLAIVVFALGRSGAGARRIRIDPSRVDLRRLAEKTLYALGVTAAVWIPFVLLYAVLPFGLASILSLPLGIAAVGYFPIALAVAVLTDRVETAFRPKELFAWMQAMGESYWMLLVVLVGIVATTVVLAALVGLVPYGGSLAASLVGAYGSLLGAHALGWSFHLAMGRLGWRRTRGL